MEKDTMCKKYKSIKYIKVSNYENTKCMPDICVNSLCAIWYKSCVSVVQCVHRCPDVHQMDYGYCVLNVPK